jgi:RNA polymerase-binding transcription factor DksA
VKVKSSSETVKATATTKTSKNNSSKPEQTEAANVVYRYSDEELEEFKAIIMNRLEVSKKELKYLQGQLRGKDEKGEDDVTERHLTLEDGSATRDLEQLGQLAARQVQFINNLENALIRIKNKTYGICRQTGKLIDKARLRAVPHATLSMEAKQK